MGWLGDQYFQLYPGEADWCLLNGQLVNRAYVFRDFDHTKARCNIHAGLGMDFCVTHWLALYGKSQEASPALTVACGHCAERFESRGQQKTHMQKSHKDVLEMQRQTYMKKRSGS